MSEQESSAGRRPSADVEPRGVDDLVYGANDGILTMVAVWSGQDSLVKTGAATFLIPASRETTPNLGAPRRGSMLEGS